MRIDVAKELSVCVKQLDGTVLDETLHRPKFANADYWFPSYRVVAELKCLTEDLSSKEDFNESVAVLYDSWIKRGLIPRAQQERVQFNLRDIPTKCAREFIEPIKKRLEASTVKKANRQIKETKLHLNAPDAKGLLLLVNDGNYMLTPTMMLHLLARILTGKYSSIDSVIYFSVNEMTSVPGVQRPSLFWIDGLVPGREPVEERLRRDLQTEWVKHHSRIDPGPVFEFTGRLASDAIENIQFVRSAR
jgi:hypothetical protein